MTLPLGTRKVLVTGGGSGIGLCVAQQLLRAGGEVVVVGRRENHLQAVVESSNGRARALVADVTVSEAREGLLKRAQELMGGLDGLVLCAGTIAHEPFGAIDERHLRAQLEVNLVAPLRLGEQAARLLESGGAVVFVASTLAHRPVRTSAVYSASKAGSLAVMKALALELAPRHIRVNAVSPGVVETDMVKARLDEGKSALEALHPLGLGKPEEVASVIVSLLGAPWTTGAEWVVDGGLLLHE